MPTNVTPNLRKAFILDVEHRGARLVLKVGGVRRFGLILMGEVVFSGAQVEGIDPKGSLPVPLTSGLWIADQKSNVGEIQLQAQRRGAFEEVDELTFIIRHETVTTILRPLIGQSLRRWVGFYPMPGDLRR